MCSLCSFLKSTIGRKILMALTGLALVLFILGHVLGNLQIYLGAHFINEYAYHLHSLPAVVMWGVRLSLLGIIGVHIWAAVSLTLDNRRARPEAYAAKANVQMSFASRAMRWSGVVLAVFIVFHILHFTARNVPGSEYADQIADVALVKHGHDVYNGADKVMVFNVNDMMVAAAVTVASLASGSLMNCSGNSVTQGWTAVNLATLPFLALAIIALVLPVVRSELPALLRRQVVIG